MLSSLFRTCFLISLALAFSVSARAQSQPEFDPHGRWINGVSEPWFFEDSQPKIEVVTAQKKWAAIAAEIQESTQSGWHGDYFEGSDTHGDYLRWSPKNGFVWFKVDKCMARVMSFSYGNVVSTPTSIQLLPEKAVNGAGGHGHSSQSAVRFLPIRWSKDQLLVAENQIASFGDYVAGLGRYNELLLFVDAIWFFSKTRQAADEGEGVSAPIVPPGYERFIKKPIEATVVSVGRAYVRRSENEWWDDLVTPLTLKLSRTGATRKLKFRIGDSAEVIEITAVSGKSATARIVRSVRKKPCVKFSPDDDCSDGEYDAIEVGLKASTRPSGS